jgi:hypothetical protein
MLISCEPRHLPTKRKATPNANEEKGAGSDYRRIHLRDHIMLYFGLTLKDKEDFGLTECTVYLQTKT